MQKFEMPITAPLGVLEQKKIWIYKFLPRGYLHTKNDQNRWDEGVKLRLSWNTPGILVFLQMYLHSNLS